MKTAMIWGANGGIGRALVKQLLSDDWAVVGITRHPQPLEDLHIDVVEANVSSPFEVQAAVTQVSQMFDEVSLWIYSVGDIASAKVGEMDPEDWQRILDANLTGAFLATHYSLPLLSEEAHLIYIGAISERLRLPGLAAYSAAKAGLEAFIEAFSKEQRQRRVSNVRPSAVETGLWDKVSMRLPEKAASPEEIAEQIFAAHSQGHKGTLDLK